MTAATAIEIADRAVQGTTWCLVVAPADQVRAAALAVEEDLRLLLEDEGRAVHRVVASSVGALIDGVCALPAEDIGVYAEIDMCADDALRELDWLRNRLLGRARVVVVLTDKDATRLRGLAPNFWSWAGSREPFTWGQPRPEAVTAARLRVLRADSILTDEQMLGLFDGDRPPTDPESVERLALLGRGDLLGD